MHEIRLGLVDYIKQFVSNVLFFIENIPRILETETAPKLFGSAHHLYPCMDKGYNIFTRVLWKCLFCHVSHIIFISLYCVMWQAKGNIKQICIFLIRMFINPYLYIHA